MCEWGVGGRTLPDLTKLDRVCARRQGMRCHTFIDSNTARRLT